MKNIKDKNKSKESFVFGTKILISYFHNKLSLWALSKCICGHIKHQHKNRSDYCKCCVNKQFIKCEKFRPAEFLMMIDFSKLPKTPSRIEEK